MKANIHIEQEIEVKTIRIQVAVRYEEEDIPKNFPMRHGDLWDATVDIDTGIIKDWPQGQTGDMHMKVCDEGTYTLYDAEGKQIKSLENEYVPHGVVPGEYGDYIILKIDANGKITNWPKNPDLSSFLELA